MGPLAGIRIIEIAGIGPAPYCAMVLADLGAQVIRIDRPRDSGLGLATPAHLELLNRGRPSIAVDLKQPAAVETILRLLEGADGLIEGMRPGVMERLGLGPDICLTRFPRLVYGRVTGWGQDGPLSATAGHDINYIAVAGALGAIGRPGERPVPPLNLIGDYGGGAMYLAVGMLAAILSARTTGVGQVVDAAMVDGAAQLMTIFTALAAAGRWPGQRGDNLLDGGAPFYDTYETQDGRFVAVGAIEPKFYAQLIQGLCLDAAELPAQYDRDMWPVLRARFAAVFLTQTRDAWATVFDGTDACVSPVLDRDEVSSDPHIAARQTLIEIDGLAQPAPAPRFSHTVPGRPTPPVAGGADSRMVLRDAGFAPSEIDALIAARVVYEALP
ncbi:MAG: CoA transferase [Alphaproteobacteria bacterium]|nr:CoA transferase [Alphaproteobacteria bacterium]